MIAIYSRWSRAWILCLETDITGATLAIPEPVGMVETIEHAMAVLAENNRGFCVAHVGYMGPDEVTVIPGRLINGR